MAENTESDGFPPEWQDDQRMAVLFAAFRDKSLNPHSWNQKMNFWKTLITKKCKQKGTCSLSLDNLASTFERKGKSPKCLDLVVQEMIRLKKLRNLSDIEASGSSKGWLSWSLSVVKKPISWSFSRLLGSPNTNTEKLVYLPDLLQDKCNELLRQHYRCIEHDISDHILELEELKSKYQQLFPTDIDLHVVLQQLQTDRKILLQQINDKEALVKFCKEGEKEVKPIEDIELSLYNIIKVQRDLEKQIESLSEKCDSHTQDAKVYVREGKKKMALQCLRRRKAVGKVIDKKSHSLDILHTMLLKIQDAANNEMVLKAYKAGVSALKSTSQTVNIDKVENVMDDLQEVLEDQDEINRTLSAGEITLDDSSVADLESELDAMLNEDQQQTDIDDLADLMSNLETKDAEYPNIPTTSPVKRMKGGNSNIAMEKS
uniref:Charged multivesicular body protein 7 n=1 Tax=Testudinalia testudinalis TaxID=2126142 RepID=A0A2P1L4E0_TESTE|nr:charged multivesicular body protein 7 [Testudinalia testudinalis]